MVNKAPHTPDYLHECLALHSELAQLLFKKPQNLAAIERAVKNVRSSRRLRHEDIRSIVESPHFSAGQEFWRWPAKAEIEEALGAEDLGLWKLPTNEKPLIKRLLGVFKSIEAVSVILRFVAPRDYGILSAPVEHILGVRSSASSVDKYIGYAQDLRRLRDSRGFETAAQVDMALWTLQVGAVEGRLPDSARINRSWKEDRELRSIRVTNLASRLFDDMDRLDLAEALDPSRAELAGQLAALAFEVAVRKYTKAKQDQDLLHIINARAPEAVASGVAALPDLEESSGARSASSVE